jgi:hypothetical protein
VQKKQQQKWELITFPAISTIITGHSKSCQASTLCKIPEECWRKISVGMVKYQEGKTPRKAQVKVGSTSKIYHNCTFNETQTPTTVAGTGFM